MDTVYIVEIAGGYAGCESEICGVYADEALAHEHAAALSVTLPTTGHVGDYEASVREFRLLTKVPEELSP